MDIIKIDIPIYETEILVIANAKRKNANKYLIKNNNGFVLDENKDAMSCVTQNRYGQYRVMYMEKLDINELYFVKVLVHECLHLTVRILSDVGIPIKPFIDYDNKLAGDEAAAYLQEYIFEQIMQYFLNKN